MQAQPDIAAIGALVGDPSRAAMLQAMLGGQALPASELARLARIRAQTASGHLARLLEGGLVTCRREGRHRYYQIATPEVAEVLEQLALVARAAPIRSLRESDAARSLADARTCYDHLAGRLGVHLADRLLAAGWLAEVDGQWTLTAEGMRRLTGWGMELPRSTGGRRVFIRQCLDWSERRPHLAGALGAAIMGRCLEIGWLTRLPGTRAVHLTATGRKGFLEVFGFEPGAGGA